MQCTDFSHRNCYNYLPFAEVVTCAAHTLPIHTFFLHVAHCRVNWSQKQKKFWHCFVFTLTLAIQFLTCECKIWKIHFRECLPHSSPSSLINMRAKVKLSSSLHLYHLSTSWKKEGEQRHYWMHSTSSIQWCKFYASILYWRLSSYLWIWRFKSYPDLLAFLFSPCSLLHFTYRLNNVFRCSKKKY